MEGILISIGEGKFEDLELWIEDSLDTTVRLQRFPRGKMWKRQNIFSLESMARCIYGVLNKLRLLCLRKSIEKVIQFKITYAG